MKVLYISHTSEMHGSGKALLNIVLQIINRGVDVYIILPSAKGNLFEELKKNNIKCITSKTTLYIWPKLTLLRDYYLLPFRICRFYANKFYFERHLTIIVKKYKPDIIHTNVGVIHAGHYIAKKFSIPHVWHIREYQDLYFGWKSYPTKKKFLEMLAIKNNYPITITYELYKHFQLDKNKNSTVIYDGVFSNETIPKINIEKKNYFLFVGLVCEGKGTDEVIQGFISVANEIPSYELWIAGGGSTQYREKLKHYCNQSEFSDRIKFLGHRSDISILMAEAKALIVASKFEGFGFITAEAMFNGCLVIGKNSAGTKEQFDNGLAMHGIEIGLRYNSIFELSMIIKQVANKCAYNYLDMNIKAQITAIKLYNLQLNAEKIYAFYKKLLLDNGE